MREQLRRADVLCVEVDSRDIDLKAVTDLCKMISTMPEVSDRDMMAARQAPSQVTWENNMNLMIFAKFTNIFSKRQCFNNYLQILLII